MKSTIGIYKTQGEALRAVQELKSNGFTDKQISVIGHTKGAGTAEDELESQDPEHEMDKSMKVAATTVGIGAVLGPILGALAGVGILAIPGVGFLVGAGALAGAVAGLDIGLIGGGIVSALTLAGINKTHEEKYQEHLKRGDYLVIVHGSESDVQRGHDVLDAHKGHVVLEKH